MVRILTLGNLKSSPSRELLYYALSNLFFSAPSVKGTARSIDDISIRSKTPHTGSNKVLFILRRIIPKRREISKSRLPIHR